MLKATPTFTPEWWTVPGEEGKPRPTRFLLQGLIGLYHYEASLYIKHDPETGAEVITARAVEIAIEHGVLDVENLEPYDPHKPLARQLPTTPVNVLAMVAYEVLRRSVLSDAEKKDSASASKSTGSPESSTAETENAPGDATATRTVSDKAAEAALHAASGG